MMLKAGQLGLDSEGGIANRAAQKLRGVGDEALGELRAASEALREVQRLHELRRMHSQSLINKPDAVINVSTAASVEDRGPDVSPEPQGVTAAGSVERRQQPARDRNIGSVDIWGLRELYLRRVEDFLCPPRNVVVLVWKS